MTAAAIIFALLAVAVSGAVLAARLASRPAKGRHQTAPGQAAAPLAGRLAGTIGQAGCMPVIDTELLRSATPDAGGWDLTMQLRPGRQPWDTASFPATPPEVIR